MMDSPPKKKFAYPAFRFRQRSAGSPSLVMFHAPVGEVLTWATVEELSPTSSGAQRQKREAKQVAIRKFLAADPRNTIPTAVILAFGKSKASFRPTKGKQDGPGMLNLSTVKEAAAIVDGQHRLFGMKDYDSKINVPIVALLEADRVEKAFQFLVINNKATRVPPTHTKALIARMATTDLAERLRLARLAFDVEGIKDVDLVNSDVESPFYQAIDWPTTPKAKRMVQATAIELSLDYLTGLGVQELDDRDVRRSVFLVIWSVVKERWKDLWKPESRLMSKVGIVCLTRFIADLIVSWADSDDLDIEISDLEDVEEHTRKILAHMSSEFWIAPWHEKAQGGFDTTQGRDRVLAALKQLYRNGKSKQEWYVGIEIIERPTK